MSKPDGDVQLQALAEGIAAQASLLLRLSHEWQMDPNAVRRVDSAIGRAVMLLTKTATALRPDLYPDD
jgi:hypothetical protein